MKLCHILLSVIWLNFRSAHLFYSHFNPSSFVTTFSKSCQSALSRQYFQFLQVSATHRSVNSSKSFPTAHEEYGGLKAQTSAQQQTARLIELVLTKGNAAAEVFRNWIQKNDVHLLRDLMGTSIPQNKNNCVCSVARANYLFSLSSIKRSRITESRSFRYCQFTHEWISKKQIHVIRLTRHWHAELCTDKQYFLQTSPWKSSCGACRKSAPARCAWTKKSTLCSSPVDTWWCARNVHRP